MKKITYITSASFFLFVPSIILAATAAPTSCQDVKTCSKLFVADVNLLIPFLIGIGAFMFIYGLFKYIYSAGNEKTITEARTYIVYSIVFIAALISVWGLVSLVVNTFFPGSVIPQFQYSSS